MLSYNHITALSFFAVAGLGERSEREQQRRKFVNANQSSEFS
jgi:hypothetical protein